MKHRRIIGALAAGAVLALGQGTARAVVDCTSIAPSSDPAVNAANIQGCLDTGTVAHLQAGTFEVSQGIVVGSGDSFTGSPSTLRVAATYATNYLLRYVGSNATVSGLTIDAYNRFGYTDVIVTIANVTPQPSNNVLENSTVTGGANPSLAVGNHSPTLSGPTAVSIGCTTCTGNRIRYNDLTGNYRNVVFHGSTQNALNYVEFNDIYDNQCDAADFPGFGVLKNNQIWENGGYCATGHGGGIYSDDNAVGGVVEANTVWNTCGHNLDLNRSKHFTVKNNTMYAPGVRAGTGSFCGKASSFALTDISYSSVTGNTAKTEDAPQNMRTGSPATAFQDTSAAAFSDLPNQDRTVIAFQLKHEPGRGDTWGAYANYVTNNQFISTCVSASDCLGLSAFVSRGTGMLPDGTSSSATWNKFEGNRIFGSEYRTVRGGRNWWAGNNANSANAGHPDLSITYCDERTDWSADGCNDDDYRHNPPVGSTYRNDLQSPAGTQFYTYT